MRNILSNAQRPDRPVVVLTDVADIDRLISASRTRLVLPNVSVSLPSLPESGARAAESSLNGEADDCGCGLGGAAASIALLGYIAWLFGTRGSPPGWEAAELAIGAGVAVAAGAAGKLAGIAVARRRWLAGLHELLIAARNVRVEAA